MNWLAQMLGVSPKNVMVDPQRRAPSWTTPEELATARQYDLAYGDPSAGFFQPGAMMRMPRTLPEMMTAFNRDVLGALPRQAIDEGTASRLYGAWLASRSSPVAALGFDPRAMITAAPKLTEGRDLTLGGTYSPSKDEIFTTGKYDSTFAHEAIHRGIQKLREAGMFPKKAEPYNEERLTRAFMAKYFGDVEKGRGETGDKQVESGRSILANPYDNKVLDEIEAAAARFIAQQTPRGPR